MITGASGFVGSNLVAYAKNNGIDTSSVSLRNGISEKLPAHIDAVVHLAGKAHDVKNISDPSVYYEVNTELTKKIFDTFLLSNATVFIFLSSVKAAADTVIGSLTENTTAEPATAYGKSKLLAEEYLLSKTIPANKKLYILRPCMIHGPGNKGNLNLLYNLVKKGIPYPLAAFENMRSFLSVDNLCFVIRELVQRNDIPQGIYNLADDKALSTNEVIRIMGEELSMKIRFLKISRSFIEFVARVGDKIHFPLNTAKLKKLTENYIVDTQKLRNALKKPLPIDSENGLRISIRAFSQ